MSRARGSALLEAVRFLRAHFDDALDCLPEKLHPYLDERVSRTQWYPEEDLLELIRACVKLAPGCGEAALVWMGETSASAHLRGAYADLPLTMTPDRQLHKLWSTLHDSGKLRSDLEAPGVLHFSLSGYAHPSRELCMIMRGYIRQVLCQSGLTDAQVEELSCELRGDETCAWRAIWTSGSPRPISFF